MLPFLSTDLLTNWKTFQRYMTNQPMEVMNEQLKELITGSVLETMSNRDYPCESMVCPTLPVGPVECCFSQMKMVKTLLKNHLEEVNPSHLKKIAIEIPQTLPEKELEETVDIWNRKPPAFLDALFAVQVKKLDRRSTVYSPGGPLQQ